MSDELRNATIEEYRILGTLPDPRLDPILATLATTCAASIAKLCFVDGDTTWVKSSNTFNFAKVPKAQSFSWKYVVEPRRTVIEPDLGLASSELRAALANYTPEPIAAVAAVPLTAPNGLVIGALVVLDSKPRDFTMTQVEALTRAARKVMELLESIKAAYELSVSEQVALTHNTGPGDRHTGVSPITEQIEIVQLADNSRTMVEDFVTDNLARAGWWAAQIWWAEDDQLFPEPWILDSSAPEVLSRLRSRSGAVPIPFTGVEFAHPTLLDLEAAGWLGNLANIGQSGVRHLMVLDIVGALSTSLRLVFVVPEGVRVKPETISALETGARLLPNVLRQEQARGELLYRSTHDPLTGLLNRRGLDQVVAQMEAIRAEQLHAIFYLDLDHFKAINDSHGHAVGDQLLKHVAAQILRQMRPTDSVVRLGGDEFLVVAKNIGSSAAAYTLGRRLLQALNGSFVAETGNQLKVAASIGASLWRTNGDFESALRVADTLMYQAKRAGGSLAVEELAGSTNPDDSTHIGVSVDGTRLLNVYSAQIHFTSNDSPAGRLVTVDSPLRAISATQVADKVDLELARTFDRDKGKVLLRFSNHFWNHGRMIPQVLETLLMRHPDSDFLTVIDSSLVGNKPTEALEYFASQQNTKLVISGFGSGQIRFSILDQLKPVGIDVGALTDPRLDDGVAPSLALRAAVSVGKSVDLDVYALDQVNPLSFDSYGKLGIRFYCQSKPFQVASSQE